MANNVKYERPLNFFNGRYKNSESRFECTKLKWKKIFFEKIEKWPLLFFLCLFFLKMIFIIDCIHENVSNFDMMVALTMATSVPNRVFRICSV